MELVRCWYVLCCAAQVHGCVEQGAYFGAQWLCSSDLTKGTGFAVCVCVRVRERSCAWVCVWPVCVVSTLLWWLVFVCLVVIVSVLFVSRCLLLLLLFCVCWFASDAIGMCVRERVCA